MDITYSRYPSKGFTRYLPGSKGLNSHYKGFREGPYGIVGYQTIRIREPTEESVSEYVDQKGVSTFAYKIPSLKTWKTAAYMDRIPRGGIVPRIIGEQGDTDGGILSEELLSQVRGKDMSFDKPNPTSEDEYLPGVDNPPSNTTDKIPSYNDSGPVDETSTYLPGVDTTHSYLPGV